MSRDPLGRISGEQGTEEEKTLSYLKRVTSDLRLSRRSLQELEDRQHAPIAIVGMSCRYPGGVASPAGLWEMLAAGAEGISRFPSDRGWDLEALYNPDPDHAGTAYVREGGFLHDAPEFDADFFGISPREALAMDPQQRLLLEAVWEALENAAIDPHSLRGSQTGVFAGVSASGYAAGQFGPADGLDGYLLTGNATSVVAGRVAYTFGLEGPAVALDTACSSSLVALDCAVHALRDDRCTLALAGGVTVMASPGALVEFCAQRVAAPDGRCKSFAAAADGAGWSEGVGVLLLERLVDAQANGHRVLAVVRGSAVNHDGASNGLTAPNGPSQQRVIAQALANARLSATQIDAVEAHGTGTRLGDPIEAQALQAIYGRGRNRPLWLGSLKSSIGHSVAAAGIGGVIKMVMAMHHGVLPQTLHVDAPSPQIDWSDGVLSLLEEAVAWSRNGEPRRAAISSFGISGTNAHLIVEEASPADVERGSAGVTESRSQQNGEEDERRLPVVPVLVSAKSDAALAVQAERLHAHLQANPELDTVDVAWTLAAGRAHFERRAAVVSGDRDELLEGLAAISRGEPAACVSRGVARQLVSGGVCFTFPGQGCQWLGMGVELLESSAVFARSLGACEEALRPHVDWSLQDVLRGADGAPSLTRVEVLQPALFAVMVSLAELWRVAGVKPEMVIGHSQGEIAAAAVAGALSLPDAARVSALRAKALAKLAGKGGMIAVSLPREELDRLLGSLPPGEVSLAAVNGPASMVLSGSPGALEEVLARCAASGIRAKAIAVDYASHSAQVEAIREELLEALAPIAPGESEIPLFSTLTGEPIEGSRLNAEYWYRSLREPVRFEQAARSALDHGAGAFIEVSPHPVLSPALEETIESSTASEAEHAGVVGSLRRGEGGAERFAMSLAEAHLHGLEVDWGALFAGHDRRSVELPTYAFERRRYWLEEVAPRGDLETAGQVSVEHPLLGAMLSRAEEQGWIFTGRLSLDRHSWLGDHVVLGASLLPASCLLELALAAGAHVGAEQVEELVLETPLTLPESGSVDVQLTLSDCDEDGRRLLGVYSRVVQTDPSDGERAEDPSWTRHAGGVLVPAPRAPSEQPHPTDSWPPSGAEPIETDDLYERLAVAGYEYGPVFQGLQAAWRRGNELFGEVALDSDQARLAGGFGAHPALLDAALHVLLGVTAGGEENERVSLPFAFNGVRVHKSAVMWRVRLTPDGKGAISLQAVDEHGDLTLTIDSLTSREIDPSRLGVPVSGGQATLLAVRWDEAGAPREGDFTVQEIDAGVEGLGAVDQVPDLVSCRISGEPDGVAPTVGARRLVTEVLELLKAFLADDRFAPAILVVVTEHAVAVGDGEAPSLIQAPIWGLVRTAQLEHPGRFVLLDSDDLERSREVLTRGLPPEEPQLAVREGRLLAPRLRPVKSEEQSHGLASLDPDRTVLITGGTGTLGSMVARHLAEVHGARRFILASRRGGEAGGASELLTSLEALGARARIVACDVSRRSELEALIDGLDGDERLGAVIHAAGVLDDGVITSLDSERLDRVFAPKLDAAIHLHELTEGMDLTSFVLFSSAAATIGSAGQANYAAANAFLDALAQHRHAIGLEARSVAWGLWRRRSAMTGEVTVTDEARLGGAALDSRQALELLEEACALPEPLALALPIDIRELRERARSGTLPALMRSLVSAPARRRSEARGALARRLGGVGESERHAILLEIVQAEVAAILGHRSGAAIERDRAFKELGFDSLSAVELRNRLASVTGLRLPASLAFDYPTCAAVAVCLRERIEGERGDEASAPKRMAAPDEPIAIVGMSCRYPGGVGSPQDLWQLVASGTDAISGFPDDRGWDLERLFDPDPDHPGTSCAREGGFIRDADRFDASFFSISPRDALTIDPQQRLLLEGAWEALESAGIDPETLRGSRTGVFAGTMTYDYGAGSAQAQREGFDTATLGGSVVSGRVSYTFGFEGPALTIDTACSSSLVALHQACQALCSGECDLALAGGVTVISTPGMFVFFSRQRGLAPDGRCKPFSAGANGAGFADGMGLVLVERLSDALRNGHHVMAVVRGSAVNQDGASNGLTAPNGPSQERVIREALANAGLTTGDVDAVEAHGTGTALGDPIEAQALLATYGQDRDDGPLRLGSIKSNIGHTQGAAGIAGVIKMVEALRNEVLPKSLHIDEPTPHVDWTEGQVELLTEAEPWAPNGHPRRAGISSFGASGTNAHVIIEQAPDQADTAGAGDGSEAHGIELLPWLLSAESEQALREQARRLSSHLSARTDLQPLDVAFTLARGRAHMRRRAAVLGSDRESLLAGLEALANDEATVGVVEGAVSDGAIAFMFTGQGAQHAAMGKELYETFPCFADALEGQWAEFDRHLDRPLRDVMFAEPGSSTAALLDRTELTQPALFAIEMALYRLLESFGVTPNVLIGHSIGELVAAHVAGVLSLADAVTLVAARGRLMGTLPKEGAMLAVQATEEEVRDRLDERLSVAAVNGPCAVVVSGDAEAIEQLETDWRGRGRKTTRLRVSHAFHSPHMDPMLEELRGVAEGLTFNPPELQIISNLTGRLAGPEIAGPDYWVAQARQPVRFADGIAAIETAGATRLLEVGPDCVLSAMAPESLSAEHERHVLLACALRAGRGEVDSLLSFLADAHVHGVGVDWGEIFAGQRARLLELPTYAFQRQRFWVESGVGAGNAYSLGQAAIEHPLLGAAVRLAQGRGWLFTGRISLRDHPWLRDHAVMGTVLLPGACFVELALAAGRHVDADTVEELTLEAPLILDEGSAVRLQVVVSEPDEHGRHSIGIHSAVEGVSPAESEQCEWTRNADGFLAGDEAPARSLPQLDAVWPPSGARELDSESFYDRLAGEGYEYGPAFQGLRRAWRHGEDLFAEVALDDDQAHEADRFSIHPALLDAAFHTVLQAASGDRRELAVPFSFRGVRLPAPGESSLRVRLEKAQGEGLKITALTSASNDAMSIESVIARPVDTSRLRATAQEGHGLLFSVDWAAGRLPQTDGSARRVAMVGDFPDLVGEIPSELQRYPDLEALARSLDDGAPSPEAVIAPLGASSGDEAAAHVVHLCARRTLELLKAWLADERLAESKLLLVTRGAVALGENASPDLAGAAAWGLARSAQSEHPGRFGLLDLDGTDASHRLLEHALFSDEPQLALRDGVAYIPQLGRLAREDHTPAQQMDPLGTVLITGGTGGLGALLARHLAKEMGVRHLLLVSRRGLDAEGASELQTSLTELGCEVYIAACDVADRDALSRLLDGIPPGRPLTAIIHAAGVRDDGVITSLDGERLSRVLAPKVDAAVHLHELTEHIQLSEFVLFSSIAATLGSPGQASYAAANAALDALATRRRAQGLTAQSLAFGAWATATGMTATLGEADRARWQRVGITALSDEQGLQAIDLARGVAQPSLVAARLDLGSLRVLARAGGLPAIMRNLVGPRGRRGGEQAGSLARALAGAPRTQWDTITLQTVIRHVSAVLGHASDETIDPNRTFKELGFDSLAAVELRNRLGDISGVRLAATLVFDYPTSFAVAGHLCAQLADLHAPRLDQEIDRLETLIASDAENGERERIAVRLQALVERLNDNRSTEDANASGGQFQTATPDELYALIDQRWGEE